MTSTTTKLADEIEAILKQKPEASEVSRLKCLFNSNAAYMSAYQRARLSRFFKEHEQEGEVALVLNISAASFSPAAAEQALPKLSFPQGTNDTSNAISCRTDQLIVVDEDRKSLSFLDCHRCTIEVKRDVDGSIVLDNCSDIRLTSSSHQLRLNQCHRMILRVQVKSPVTLDHCSKVSLADCCQAVIQDFTALTCE